MHVNVRNKIYLNFAHDIKFKAPGMQFSIFGACPKSGKIGLRQEGHPRRRTEIASAGLCLCAHIIYCKVHLLY